MMSFEEFRNEAAVELAVIIPLFGLLGYDVTDVSPKHPVTFQEGRTGRKPEADFVLFAGPLHTRENSLVVVEAKRPGERDARRQAESYAFAIGAPLFLTCDGLTIELWEFKVTRSSERVLSFAVSEIDSRRGELDRFLRKEVVVAYCKTLPGKSIVEVTEDFGGYENAELRRTIGFARIAQRRLRNRESGDAISSDAIVHTHRSGAVILGPSGSGKTTLSNGLLRSQIELRMRERRGRIAVHIRLPELRSGESVLAFAARRLSAHNPSVSERSIVGLIGNPGLSLILDEFDRLSSADQNLRETEIRLLLRDHDQLSVLVFSRISAKPILPLPSFHLEALDNGEKLEILEMRAVDNPHMALYSMPHLLRDLCGNALILTLVADHYQERNRFPQRIEQLFRAWLERTIQSDSRNPADAAHREAALVLLAQQRSCPQLLATAALAHLEDAGFSHELFNDLVRCDALVVDAGIISFHHEALADYLRALWICRLPPREMSGMIVSIPLERGSLFPVLLMALLPSLEAQESLWRRLVHLEFAMYLEVLRYRADLSTSMPTGDDAAIGLKFLGNLYDGVVLPVDGFFPTLSEHLFSELVGDDAKKIAVVGRANQDSVAYAFLPREGDEPTITLGDSRRAPIEHFVNLGPSGLRLDSGRLVGLQLVREALLKIVDTRHLVGRDAWTSERLASRLHYLRSKYNFPLRPTDPLNEWEALLTDHSSQSAHSDWPRKFLFSVKSVLGDIALLRSRGCNQIADDSPRIDIGGDANVDEEALAQALNEHYRRMQTIYREIAEESFGSVCDQLGFYSALPVRWQVTVVRDNSTRRLGPSLQYLWVPAEDWSRAGADVSFSNKLPPYDRSHFDRVRVELRRLGRLTKQTAIWAGASTLLSFPSSSRQSAFVESSPFRGACNQIRKDIEALFRGMPVRDRTPSWED